jgi:hypothetical protein
VDTLPGEQQTSRVRRAPFRGCSVEGVLDATMAQLNVRQGLRTIPVRLGRAGLPRMFAFTACRFAARQTMRPEKTIHVFINKQKFELSDPVQTGASLKALAGIAPADPLFLQQPGDDLVIANGATVTLKNGSQLHSQPPADYGAPDAVLSAWLADAGIEAARATLYSAPGQWSFLVVSDYQVPDGYAPQNVRLLVKLPPTFPDAAPDMFWVQPALRTLGGAMPKATSSERLLGEDWQRFSWHLASGAWIPGSSTLRDFLRCVAGRFQRCD